MTVRNIVRIDEARCDGCGQCVTACVEGAIALVDGKARLVSESYCDGLGACLGHCPQGAIAVEPADAAPFDEAAVARHLGGGDQHARPAAPPAHAPSSSCPGSRVMSFPASQPADRSDAAPARSALRQWPVQLHLVPPTAPYFRAADVLLAADCVAYAAGNFHENWLPGRALAIACPKLDTHQEIYLDKLVSLIDDAEIASLTVMVMEVPCCGGLVRLAQEALARSARFVPLAVAVIAVNGGVLRTGPVPSPSHAGESLPLPTR